jgi:hypothetical protein
MLDSLLAKDKCLVLFSQNMADLLVAGNQVIIGRGGEWHLGSIHQVPACTRRKIKGSKARKEPRMFQVKAIVGSGPKIVEMELGELNYAQGCMVPKDIGTDWAWARVDAYVKCAYVACGQCLNPYTTAAGHKCKQCKTAVHNLCSQMYAGVRDLGSEKCPNCRN